MKGSNVQRGWVILLTSVSALSLVGFFIGVRTPAVPTAGTWTLGKRPMSTGTRPARTNAELVIAPWSSDAEPWRPDTQAKQAPVPPTQTKVKEAALTQRQSRRAFDGAPPVIPHPIGQRSAVECWVCHEQGASIGQVSAPPAGHGYLAACTQCHVPAASMLLVDATAGKLGPQPAPSEFAGIDRSPAAQRWAATSPPRMPHRTFMRERCSACHGPTGRPGLQTTHPERPSCLQCHAMDARWEQLP